MNEIYVVDDSTSVCIAIERMLAGRGYEVVTERSGKAALAYLERARPRLVICDVLLPDVDGREICKLVRREPRLASTPVIAISGLVDAYVEATALRAGALRILKKPFSPDELVSAVEASLGQKAGDPPRRAPEGAEPERRQESLSDLLAEGMKSLPSLRFGLVVGPEGRVLRQVGTQKVAVEEVVEPLVEIVRRSAVVAEWLGQTDPHQLVFQADDGLVIAQRYGDHLAVAALTDASVLGMTRFAFARLRRKLDTPTGPQRPPGAPGESLLPPTRR